MTILIKSGYVVTGDNGGTQFDRADILVEDDRLVAIGPDAGKGREAEGPDVEVIDASHMIVAPGFINAHIHSEEGFQQAVYGNLPLEPWLMQAYSPFGFPLLSEREQYLRTMLAAIESIRSGGTTVQDDFVNPPGTPEAQNAAIHAYADIGIRAWSAVDMWDKPFRECLPYVADVFPSDLLAELDALPVASTEDQINLFHHHFKNWHGHDDRIRVIIAPCGPQRCTPDLWQEVDRLSKAHRIPLHSHCLETKLQAVQAREHHGKTWVEYLDSLGVLSDRLTLVHAIWVTDRDIAMMAEHGVSIVHNPLSNLKCGSGVCPIRKHANAGIAIGIGTDGVCTADGVDIFEAIRAASLMHTMGALDYEQWVGPHEVYRMATVGGARTGLMEDEVGSLEVGKKADIILLDRDHWGFIPLSDPVQHIAFSVNSEVVKTVIINGKTVMRDRRIVTMDEDAIKAEIKEAAERFLRDHVAAMNDGSARFLPYMREIYMRASNQPLELSHHPRFSTLTD